MVAEAGRAGVEAKDRKVVDYDAESLEKAVWDRGAGPDTRGRQTHGRDRDDAQNEGTGCAS